MSFILSICMDTFLSYNSQDLSFCLKSKPNLKNVFTDTHNFKNLQTTLHWVYSIAMQMFRADSSWELWSFPLYHTNNTNLPNVISYLL